MKNSKSGSRIFTKKITPPDFVVTKIRHSYMIDTSTVELILTVIACDIDLTTF